MYKPDTTIGHMCFVFTQDLPAEEMQEDLIENGQVEDILQKSCPEEFRALKEEEVTTIRLRIQFIWSVKTTRFRFLRAFLLLEIGSAPPLNTYLLLMCVCLNLS